MMFRILLIAFNVAVVGLLVYRIVATFREPMSPSRKMVIRIGGTLLLLGAAGNLPPVLRSNAAVLSYLSCQQSGCFCI